MAVRFDKMFGYLILIIISTALAPTLFSNANLSGVSGAPAWVVTIAPILVGVFLVMLWYKSS